MRITESKIYKFTLIPVRERYYNNESNYGVYKFKTNDEIPYMKKHKDGFPTGILAGKTQQLTIGLEYEVEATAEYNRKYEHFDYIPKTVTLVKPKTISQQESFLRTLVTERQAESLLQAYPHIVEDVINGKAINTRIIKGIGDKTWAKIKAKIENNYVISDILAMLSPLGVTITMIKKLLSFEGNPVILKQKLIENPYILTQINGIGFKRADEIALKLNKDIRVSKQRTTAFVARFLNYTANNDGDTWVHRKTLDTAVKENIPECYEIYEAFIKEQEITKQTLIIQDDKVGMKCIYNTEYAVLGKLDRLSKAAPLKQTDIKSGIETAEKTQGFTYTDEQKQAIIKCCESNVTLITGQAGTGKSTILRGLVEIYKNYNISCCALSAKAAQRIAEVTGHEASTIHRLLGYANSEFAFNEKNPLACEVLILDEASMVNAEIFLALLSAVKIGTKVIICGDDEQLPPIGSGNIFHDLLRCEKYCCVKLTKNLRQAERSGIITDSRKIRQNELPVFDYKSRVITGELQDMIYDFREDREEMRDYAIKTYLKSVSLNGLDSTIIITPCKQNRINSTEEINKIVQDALIPATAPSMSYGRKEFRVGARVIQRANDYDKKVFNGETGCIISIMERRKKDSKEKEKIALVKFGKDKIIKYNHENLANLELAYALTVHVTQGSGYDNVIILIDNSHYLLLDSCLLYTAITRTKKRCLLIAEEKAFLQCVKNKASERKTWLSLYKPQK